jgi:HlyD family secretion protein
VVTYTVLVTANNDAGQLMPGMTANVRIVTDTRE